MEITANKCGAYYHHPDIPQKEPLRKRVGDVATADLLTLNFQ
jgi:hypothetical protein